MKKLFLSLMVACMAIAASIDQTYAQATKSRFGMKVGADLMTLGSATSSGISINYNYRPGFQAGFYADVPMSAQVSFLPQLLYTQKGGNVNVTIGSTNITGKTQVNYIDVPLLFGYKPQPALTLFVGPQVSFLTSQSTSATVTGSGSASGSSTDGFRKTILGGNIGVGYNLEKNIGVNLNYIFDLQHTADGSVAADTGEKNSGFVLSLSFLF